MPPPVTHLTMMRSFFLNAIFRRRRNRLLVTAITLATISSVWIVLLVPAGRNTLETINSRKGVDVEIIPLGPQHGAEVIPVKRNEQPAALFVRHMGSRRNRLPAGINQPAPPKEDTYSKEAASRVWYEPKFSIVPMDPPVCPRNFRIQPQSATTETEVFLLIVVTSKANNARGRKAIRETWGTLTGFSDLRLAFVVGRTSDDADIAVTEESDTFTDMIQGDFTDNNNEDENKILKTVAILEFAAKYCPKAKYVLKMNDDVYLNISPLVKFLRNVNPSPRTIFGEVSNTLQQFTDGQDDKTRRSMSSSERSSSSSADHDMSHHHHQQQQHPHLEYPLTYMKGHAYIVGHDLVRPLLEEVVKMGNESFLTAFVGSNEDVFVTGVAAKALQVRHMDVPGLHALNLSSAVDEHFLMDGSQTTFSFLMGTVNMFYNLEEALARYEEASEQQLSQY